MWRCLTLLRMALTYFVVLANPTSPDDNTESESTGSSIVNTVSDSDDESNSDSSNESKDVLTTTKTNSNPTRILHSHTGTTHQPKYSSTHSSVPINNEPEYRNGSFSSSQSFVSQDRYPSSVDSVYPSFRTNGNHFHGHPADPKQSYNHGVKLHWPHSMSDADRETLSSRNVSADAFVARPRPHQNYQRFPRPSTVPRKTYIERNTEDNCQGVKKDKMRSFVPETASQEIQQTPMKEATKLSVKDSDSNGDTLEEFIRNFVKRQMNVGVKSIKFFDAAVVYDRKDYEHVKLFIEEVKMTVEGSIGETIRIELFDSIEFAQSKVLVVEDVIKRCSVVFVYLTHNCTEETFRLFCDEGVGMTRLSLGPSDLPWSDERTWVLKPVHTQAPRHRRYSTPVGLVSLQGIDWYDKESSHTRDKLITVMRDAVQQRKHREHMANTKLDYHRVEKDRFTKNSMNQKDIFKQTSMNRKTPRPSQIPVNTTAPSIHEDATSFRTFNHHGDTYGPQGFGVPPPSYHDVPASYRVPGPNMTSMYPPGYQTVDPFAAQYNQLYPQMRPHQQPYNPNTYQQYYAATCPSQQLNNTGYPQPVPCVPAPTLQGLDHIPIINRSQLELHPVYHTQHPREPMQSSNVEHSTGSYQRTNMAAPLQLHQSNYQHQSPQTAGQMLSRDQPASNGFAASNATSDRSGNYLRDPRNDAPARGDLSVVSRVTGELIVNPDLSTDDVEVDNPSGREEDMFPIHHSKQSGPSFKKGKHSNETSDTPSEESDDDAPVMKETSKKSKSKVMNFYGCENIQLGAECKVIKVQRSKPTKKRRSSSKKSASTTDSKDVPETNQTTMNSLKLSEHQTTLRDDEDSRRSQSTVYRDSIDMASYDRDVTAPSTRVENGAGPSTNTPVFLGEISCDMYQRRQQRRSEDREEVLTQPTTTTTITIAGTTTTTTETAYNQQTLNMLNREPLEPLHSREKHTKNRTAYTQNNIIGEISDPYEHIHDDDLFGDTNVNENVFSDSSESPAETATRPKPELDLDDKETKVYNQEAEFSFSNFKGKQQQWVINSLFPDRHTAGTLLTNDGVD